MRQILLAAAVAAVLFSAAPAAHAQQRPAPFGPVDNTGRPAFCFLGNLAGDDTASRGIIASALDDLGYSTSSGAGARIYAHSNRAMYWLWFSYSQGYADQLDGDSIYANLLYLIRDWIQNQGGDVPLLRTSSVPIFQRALRGCRLA